MGKGTLFQMRVYVGICHEERCHEKKWNEKELKWSDVIRKGEENTDPFLHYHFQS